MTSTASVLQIIQRRREALIRQWIADPLVQVQIENPEALGSLTFLDDGSGPTTVAQVGRRRRTSVAMASRPGNPDEAASVWVASSYQGYTGAYLGFLKAAYGVDADSSALAGFDIDHMLNRARAPLDTTFIRVEAVDSSANRAWGSLFEKTASNPDFYANQKRERRTMSYTIVAKLAGQMPPRGPDDRAGLDRLADFFAARGLDRKEARDGLQSMLDFAYSLR